MLDFQQTTSNLLQLFQISVLATLPVWDVGYYNKSIHPKFDFGSYFNKKTNQEMETTRQYPVNMTECFHRTIQQFFHQRVKKPSNQWSYFTDLPVLHDHLCADFSVIFCEHSWVPAQLELVLTIRLHWAPGLCPSLSTICFHKASWASVN